MLDVLSRPSVDHRLAAQNPIDQAASFLGGTDCRALLGMQIAYEVFQKRYIDELGSGNLTAAVKTLREELNPLQLYPLHTEQLAGASPSL